MRKWERMEFGRRNVEGGNGKDWNAEFVGSQNSHGHTQTHTDIFSSRSFGWLIWFGMLRISCSFQTFSLSLGLFCLKPPIKSEAFRQRPKVSRL